MVERSSSCAAICLGDAEAFDSKRPDMMNQCQVLQERNQNTEEVGMAHRRQKPRSVSGKAFNVSEATDTGRTFVRVEREHRVIRQRIVQLISAVRWVAL